MSHKIIKRNRETKTKFLNEFHRIERVHSPDEDSGVYTVWVRDLPRYMSDDDILMHLGAYYRVYQGPGRYFQDPGYIKRFKSDRFGEVAKITVSWGWDI